MISPVATMWRALLAGVVFQHESIESLLRELRRNPALLTLCEFDPVPPWKARPKKYSNVSMVYSG